MEHGFYHPSRGYWQTNSDVPQHILDTYPEGTVEVPLRPGADYDWNGEEWVYFPPDPAEALEAERATMIASRFQARAALLAAGHLSAVEQAISEAEPMVQLAWAEAVEWKRTSPTIVALGAQLGLSEEDLDQLFRDAAGIEV